MRSMTCCTVDPKFATHTKGTQTQQVAVKRVKATRDPKTLSVCCVLCLTRFFQWSGQVSSVTQRRRHKANSSDWADRGSLLPGGAVHGAHCFDCFEGQD